MNTMTRLTLRTEGDTHIVVTRHFHANPEAVYRAHTEPELIQKWLLGPDGWTMPVCVNEARVWRHLPVRMGKPSQRQSQPLPRYRGIP